MYRQTIREGIAEIDWKELEYFYARGQVIYISMDLDLEETAYQLVQNNTKFVEASMQSGLIGKVTEELAKTWFENQERLLSVVVQPWVLVQRLK
ncbi:MAG TPA: DUF2288 domain-containing protein [Leptospiraceae bacterium]|nr:DUF2288 domain-containing protein [Leptospiraceae bacterium]HNC01439.1 DUF2288 domain-containing protein [Leptospiraceae bacterium]HNE09061.1 DUF2288 domain-containing protein [Leptospiraceae bacterium]HNG99772.1 DUF2288 domain-containing protein [Leptospiraceae bacterium]HNI88880.1 DUF2288 domain-containing protein [Leptospiraceae bacterium]